MNKSKTFLMTAAVLLTVVAGNIYGDEMKTPAESVKPLSNDLPGRLERIKLFLKTLQVAENLMGDHLFPNQGTFGNYYRTKQLEITMRSSDPQKTGTADDIARIENDLERFERDLIIDTVNVFSGKPSSVKYAYSAKNDEEYYKNRNKEIRSEINNMIAEWKQNAEKSRKEGADIDLRIEMERVQVGMDEAFKDKFPDRLYMQRYGFYRAVVNERFRAAGLTPGSQK